MADTSKRYNGWTNYETWCVALWIGNEEGSSRAADAMAQQCYDDAEESSTFTRDEQAALDLAEALEDEWNEANPLADQASAWSDLLSAALSEVNWHEIATHYIDDVDKDPAEAVESDVDE